MIQYNLSNREEVEWSNTWYDDADRLNPDRILMVGDSTLRELRSTMKSLAGKPVDFFGCSFSFRDPLFEKGLRCFLDGSPYDSYSCIYVQFGNHGRIGLDGRPWEADDDTMFVDGMLSCLEILKQYSSNIIVLPAFYICKPWKRFKKLKVALHIPDRLDEKENAIVLRRNELIKDFASSHGLVFRDLTAHMEESGFVRKDHIHFQDSSKKYQTEYLLSNAYE